MKPPSRNESSVILSFSPDERALLANFVGAYVSLMSQMQETPSKDDDFGIFSASPISAKDIEGRDPALKRLFPDAYANDPDAQAEFRGFSEADLVQAHIDGASSMWQALSDEGDIVVSDADIEVWVKTLAGLRIVLHERNNNDLDEVSEWFAWIIDALVSC